MITTMWNQTRYKEAVLGRIADLYLTREEWVTYKEVDIRIGRRRPRADMIGIKGSTEAIFEIKTAPSLDFLYQLERWVRYTNYVTAILPYGDSDNLWRFVNVCKRLGHGVLLFDPVTSLCAYESIGRLNEIPESLPSGRPMSSFLLDDNRYYVAGTRIHKTYDIEIPLELEVIEARDWSDLACAKKKEFWVPIKVANARKRKRKRRGKRKGKYDGFRQPSPTDIYTLVYDRISYLPKELNRPVTRKEICNHAGLSPGTVAKKLNEMISKGKVIEVVVDELRGTKGYSLVT